VLSVTPEPLTVLLLEDNQDDELLAQRAFSACDRPLSVVVARDGIQGLEALGLSGDGMPGLFPDLIVSDLKMPRCKGDDVLRRVRADERLKEIPFVIFSSSDDENDVERCLELGASGYCVKPVNYREYIESAKSLLLRWLPGSTEEKDPSCSVGGTDRATMR